MSIMDSTSQPLQQTVEASSISVSSRLSHPLCKSICLILFYYWAASFLRRDVIKHQIRNSQSSHWWSCRQNLKSPSYVLPRRDFSALWMCRVWFLCSSAERGHRTRVPPTEDSWRDERNHGRREDWGNLSEDKWEVFSSAASDEAHLFLTLFLIAAGSVGH